MSSTYTDYSNVGTIPAPIQSTAGAISVLNDKGKLVTEKVRVSRYISGKRPEYAPVSSDEEEEEDDTNTNFSLNKQMKVNEFVIEHDLEANIDAEASDKRLQRMRRRDVDAPAVTKYQRRHLAPEVMSDSESDEDDADEMVTQARHNDDEAIVDHGMRSNNYVEQSSSSEEGAVEDEIDEEEISSRRALLRMKHETRVEKELMEVEDEDVEGDGNESSEWEEYSDSSEGEVDTGPRLKPVFVRRKDRVTIQEKELAEQRVKELEYVDRRNAETRRRETLKIVETEVRKEMDESRVTAASAIGDIASVIGDCERLDITTVDTADENEDEQIAYEAWKLRELKRIKRDRDQREAMEKVKEEVDKLHKATDEERFKYFKQNPKNIVNKAQKGKYKFLQKFYHRGAFFLDEQDQVYTRDVTQPTLEDHFDKTVLPRVMQVKNFGRSGRTKYTHLVDQDTTSFDSPWANDTAMSLKFQKKNQSNCEKPSKQNKKV